MDHIDESAELYALGLLEPDERARIDDHVARCDACAARLGEAESAVAALVEASRDVPARVNRWPLATAAAFAIAAAGLLAQNVALRGSLADDGMAMSAMAESHFLHAQFHTPSGAPLDAKVVYEPHHAWLQVIAVGTPAARVHMTGTDGATTAPDRALASRDGVATTFVRRPGAIRQLDLVDAGGHTIATVRLAHSDAE